MQGDQFTEEQLKNVKDALEQLTYDIGKEELKGLADYASKVHGVNETLSKVYNNVKVEDDILSTASDLMDLLNQVIKYNNATDDYEKKEYLVK